MSTFYQNLDDSQMTIGLSTDLGTWFGNDPDDQRLFTQTANGYEPALL